MPASQPADKKNVGGENISPHKVVIVGVGNLLLSDEGVGVHVANQLLKTALPPGVTVIEGGTDGFGLLDVVSEAEQIIVIDAVKGNAAPGSLYRFGLDEIRYRCGGFKTSFHQIGLLEVLALAKLTGRDPKVIVIGVEPKSLEMGMKLTPEIDAQIPRIIELVWEELELLGFPPRPEIQTHAQNPHT